MTPDYYRTTDASDLYDLWRQHYGTETACRHLEMSAQEYLYRAPEKGSYLADLVKVQTIVQRLLAWGESPEGRDIPDKPLSLDDMATCLSISGYLVREPGYDFEPLLETLARKYGYGLVRPADEATQPPPPPSAIVSDAEIKQRMTQAIDHRDETLAAQHGERLTLHEARARARKIAEDAEAERQADLQRDWPDTAQNGTHAPYPETVLQHCVDADYARQGVAVEAEIRALLTHYGIPADSPYGDWSSELAKHEPQRWPDTTA